MKVVYTRPPAGGGNFTARDATRGVVEKGLRVREKLEPLAGRGNPVVSPSGIGGSVAKLIVTLCYLQLVVFFVRERFNIWYSP
jgi:hypothetical protein